MQAQGFSVEHNFPFPGGYITRHFGADEHIAALQIELSYNAYIDQRFFGEEELQAPNPAVFQSAQKRLQKVWQPLLAALA